MPKRYVFPTQNIALKGASGDLFQLRKDFPWDADDPLVAKYPDFFAEQPERPGRSVQVSELSVAGGIEMATHEPGERRGPGRPRKQPA